MRSAAGQQQQQRRARSDGCSHGRGAPGTQPRSRRALTVQAFGIRQKQTVIAVDPSPAPCAAQQQTVAGVPLAAAAAATFGAAFFWKRRAEAARAEAKQRQRRLEPWPEIPRPDADPRAYQMALARTRQALDVQKAVTFMKAGEPSRAMAELHRALDENAVCRSPLLDGHQTRAELRDLYKLHLLNTTAPHSFATLLQLRELLGISPQDAEEIEVAVVELGTAFSI